LIPDAEVRRIARRLDMEPRLIDLDYTLGWALRALGEEPDLRACLLFKGGTCLRKCWIPGYRFSEDLDFTARHWIGWEALEATVRSAFRRATELTGIDFYAREPRFEAVDEEYGRESLRAHVYFIGAHPRGTPRAIRLDITRHETIAFEPVLRTVRHEYSDRDVMEDRDWPCYALEEMLAEKLRAVLGQRRYAISRDLYDLHTLSGMDLDLAAVREVLPAKFSARGLEARNITVDPMLDRRDDFKTDWGRSLIPLVPEAERLEFEAVWSDTVAFVRSFTPAESPPSE